MLAGYCRAVRSHDRPDVGSKHEQGELSVRQVLLIPDVLIGRHHHVEARLFRQFQKLTVFELVRPSHFHDRVDFMPGQRATRADRNLRISNRRAYALYWSVPEQDWSRMWSTFTVIADSFRPAR